MNSLRLFPDVVRVEEQLGSSEPRPANLAAEGTHHDLLLSNHKEKEQGLSIDEV